MKNNLDKIPIFFIIGRPRSGTTMLRTIFDANKNISIPIESTVIIILYIKFRWVKNWNEKQLMKFYHCIFKQPKIKAWVLNKEQLKKDILELGEDATFERLIKLLYLNYISFFKKEEILLLGDKNPVYSYFHYYFKIILKLFPDAKVVHLTRDYRDHYLSMAKTKFETLNYLSIVCYRWKYSFNMVRKLMKDNLANYYFIRYEDLVVNPEKQITALCDFLNIPYHRNMLNYYEIKDKVLAAYPDRNVMKNHSSLFHPISADNVGKWKHKLTDQEICFAESVVGKAGVEAGYERTIKTPQLRYKLLVLPDIIYSSILQTVKPVYNMLVINLLK